MVAYYQPNMTHQENAAHGPRKARGGGARLRVTRSVNSLAISPTVSTHTRTPVAAFSNSGRGARRRSPPAFSGCDDVARPQRSAGRLKWDTCLGDGKDEIGTRGVLHQLIVHPEPDSRGFRDLRSRPADRATGPWGVRPSKDFLADPVEMKGRVGGHPLAPNVIAGRQIVHHRGARPRIPVHPPPQRCGMRCPDHHRNLPPPNRRTSNRPAARCGRPARECTIPPP